MFSRLHRKSEQEIVALQLGTSLCEEQPVHQGARQAATVAADGNANTTLADIQTFEQLNIEGRDDHAPFSLHHIFYTV
jgi:hypothetical protein